MEMKEKKRQLGWTLARLKSNQGMKPEILHRIRLNERGQTSVDLRQRLII